MKIAVMSDIHGNIYALMKTLEDIDEQRVDKIICLGDLVGYGPHPNEVIALIRRREIPCIRGNYDASVVDGDLEIQLLILLHYLGHVKRLEYLINTILILFQLH